ncbi:putative T7SS-secreted protein, partial [Mesorhizobium japonicum]|uniref:putative T7SS-secreted protein n=1 Tax=Mesorhizobium japonicum TaxID=2066070 RepID=UPI003B5C185B
MTDIAYAHSAKDLVPGDPEEIRLVAQSWRNRARDYTAMGDKLAMIDLSSAWTGNSGAAAAVRLAGQAAVWRRAGAACLAAADHLDVYASTLEDAQDDARRALQVWKDAEHDRNLRSNVIGPRDPSIDIDSTRQITAKILQSATDSVQTVGDWAADALGEAASAAQVVGQWSNLLGAMIEMELDKVGDNALSLLNAMANHPDIGLGLSAGAGLIALGALGDAGGGALDATG